MRIYKTCPKCNGSGCLPEWPSPHTLITPGMISRIKQDAPKCDLCNGGGKIITKRRRRDESTP